MALAIDLLTPQQMIKDQNILDFLISIKSDQKLKDFNGLITISNKQTSDEHLFILKEVIPEEEFEKVRKYLIREYLENIGD